MAKVAVVLSGCGFLDGAEVQEAVCSLLALDRAGHEVQCMAPDIPQMHTVDHIKGEEMEGSRNVLVESARIARGKIIDLASANVSDYDALFMPGGFGAAKNLSDFAVGGGDCALEKSTESLIKGFHGAGKPIVALCIAPALLAKALGDGVTLTIGDDQGTASALESMGAKHEDTGIGEVVVDESHKVITTPCYMFDTSVAHIGDSADKAVEALGKLLS